MVCVGLPGGGGVWEVSFPMDFPGAGRNVKCHIAPVAKGACTPKLSCNYFPLTSVFLPLMWYSLMQGDTEREWRAALSVI